MHFSKNFIPQFQFFYSECRVNDFLAICLKILVTKHISYDMFFGTLDKFHEKEKFIGFQSKNVIQINIEKNPYRAKYLH